MQHNCFQNQRLYLEETPSASSKLLSTNTLRSGFLWKTQQHFFQRQWGRDRKNRYRYDVSKKCSPIMPFYQDFVQDCSARLLLHYSHWNSSRLFRCGRVSVVNPPRRGFSAKVLDRTFLCFLFSLICLRSWSRW